MYSSLSRDGAIVGRGAMSPPNIFFLKILLFTCVLVLAIWFNKIKFSPFNNIIDLFKSHKNKKPHMREKL